MDKSNQIEKIINSSEFLMGRHKLAPDKALLDFIIEQQDKLGILPPSPNLADEEKLKHYFGEYYAMLARMLGHAAAPLLFTSKWTPYTHPDWFDHRLSDLSPENYDKDFNALSGTQILLKLPLNGTLLSLASGDGYYEYNYFKLRAEHIDCVEIQTECINHAKNYHSCANINYINDNILTYDYGTGKYDVVVIRGAIEHFTYDQQQLIFNKAKIALKPGGWFCGDTPEANKNGEKHLEEHEYEWGSESEMRMVLAKVFSHVETIRYESAERTTLFWACQK